MPFGIFSGLQEAGRLAEKAKQIADTLKHVELKETIAELKNKLADGNIELANLKGEIAELKAANAARARMNEGEKPKLQWGCYVFEGDATLYCPACWHTKGEKHPTARIDTRTRHCTVCDKVIGARRS